MLRSEVEWFPYFLHLCRCSRSYWDATSMGHEDMKRIADECDSYRQVQDILNQSVETAFKDEIWEYKQQAKRIERPDRKSDYVWHWLEKSHEYFCLFIG